MGSGEAVGRDAFGMRAMQRRRMSKVVTKAAGCGPCSKGQGEGKARVHKGLVQPWLVHQTPAGEHVLSAMVSAAALNHGALIIVVPCGAGHVAIGSDGRSPHVLSAQFRVTVGILLGLLRYTSRG